MRALVQYSRAAALAIEPMSEAHDTRVEGRGQQDARQEQFVEAHLRRIFLIIYRIVGNVADAQDLTQEAFIKALQHQEQIKDLDKAAHWLSRIATNTAIDFLRRKRRISFGGLDEIGEPVSPETHDPERQVLRAEGHGRMQEILNQLTPRERMALVLRDVEDLPAEEVARRLDCGKATVRSHIANARVKLKRLMEKQS